MAWQGLVPLAKQLALGTVGNLDKAKLLFGLGTAAVVGTAVCSAKAGIESDKRIWKIRDDDSRREDDDDGHKRYRRKRYAKEVLPLWIPCGLCMATAVISFGMSNKQLAAKALAASSAAAVAEHMLESYSEKAIEVVGEEAEQKIRQAIADDIPEEVMEKERGYVTDTDVANLYPRINHDELWFDHVTQRLFWATESDILNAESTVNQQLLDTGLATIGDFYAAFPRPLGCSGQVCDAIGWDSSHAMANKMDIIFGSKLDDATGLVMKSISYRTTVVYPRALERR